MKRVRVWTQDDPKRETCPRCDGPLSKPVEERRQRWEAFRTKSGAEQALTAILTKIGTGEYVAPSKVTFGAYLRDTWLPHLDSRVAMGELRATTVSQYRTLAESHIIASHVGRTRLRELTPTKLDKLYAELLQSGRKVRPGESPRGLSPTSVHAVHVTISAALNHALRKGELSRNVAKLADAPRPERGSRRSGRQSRRCTSSKSPRLTASTPCT